MKGDLQNMEMKAKDIEVKLAKTGYLIMKMEDQMKGDLQKMEMRSKKMKSQIKESNTLSQRNGPTLNTFI